MLPAGDEKAGDAIQVEAREGGLGGNAIKVQVRQDKGDTFTLIIQGSGGPPETFEDL